jgi:signal transduction histidine kinase
MRRSIRPLRDDSGKIMAQQAPSPREIPVEVLTEVRREEALLQAGALQSAIFHSANFSSIATDAKGVIQIFNVGAERMLGYAAADVMNKITPADISDPQEVIARAKALSSELKVTITPGFDALVFKASRGIEDIYELTYIRKDGSRFPAVVSVTALRDAQDAIIGYLLIGTDNTVRKQIEDERKRLDQLLQEKNVELESAKSVAERANLAKSDFLSSMSHELRSPLNAILGFAQLMESASPLPTDSQMESIGQILQAGWHLLKLINEILDLAMIESGKVSLSPESVSLSEVLSECRTMMEPQAQQRDIRMTFHRFDAPIFVKADRTRLKQIIINRGSCKTPCQSKWHGHLARDSWAGRPCHEEFCKRLSRPLYSLALSAVGERGGAHAAEKGLAEVAGVWKTALPCDFGDAEAGSPQGLGGAVHPIVEQGVAETAAGLLGEQVREVARREAGDAGRLVAREVTGKILLHEAQRLLQEHGVGVVTVFANAVHQPFEGVDQPVTEIGLVGDGGQTAHAVVVHAQQLGRPSAALDGGAVHHHNEFEGQTLEQFQTIAREMVDAHEQPVEDLAGGASVAALDRGQQRWFLAQIGLSNGVIAAGLQLMDRLGLFALAARRFALADQVGAIGQVVIGDPGEQRVGHARRRPRHGCGAGGIGQAVGNQAAQQQVVAHQRHATRQQAVGGQRQGRFAPLPGLGHQAAPEVSAGGADVGGHAARRAKHHTSLAVYGEQTDTPARAAVAGHACQQTTVQQAEQRVGRIRIAGRVLGSGRFHTWLHVRRVRLGGAPGRRRGG